MVGIIGYFSEFHRQAAIEAMRAAIPMITDDEFNNMLSEGFDTKNGELKKTYPNEIAQFAIACADALVEQINMKAR